MRPMLPTRQQVSPKLRPAAQRSKHRSGDPAHTGLMERGANAAGDRGSCQGHVAMSPPPCTKAGAMTDWSSADTLVERNPTLECSYPTRASG